MDVRTRARHLLWTLVGFSIVMTSPRAQEAPNEVDRPILVRRIVSSDYREAGFAQTHLPILLSRSMNRAVRVEKDATVSQILKEQFNVVQGITPQVYEEIEAHVSRLNGLEDLSKDLKAGSMLKLPDLPRGAEVAFDPNLQVPAQAQRSFSSNWNAQLFAFTDRPRFAANVSATAKTELQIRFVPQSFLKSLELPRSTASLGELNEQYLPGEESMPLTLADTLAPPAQGAWLAPAEVVSLRAFLARPAKTRPLVVIFDDSFPSQKDFSNAARFVVEASRTIRSKFGLQDAAHADSPALLQLANQQGTMFCDEDCEYPKLKLHSAMIRRSLSELSDLDPNGRVEVIYLPVNLAQTYAKQMLSEILRVTFLADSVTAGLVLTTEAGGTCPANVPRGKPDYEKVDAVVNHILSAPKLDLALRPYQPGDVMMAQTDRALVDAVVNFLWLYSMATRRPHFLSMSWTAPNLQYPALFRTNGYGLWLSAAGNEPGVNVHLALRQFAARSSDPGDVLAVTNVSCDSSTLLADPAIPVLGFSFPGRITPSLCGTSFSAPRIAWLLAAREAIKGESIQPCSLSWTQWRAAKHTKLRGLQDAAQAGQGRYATTVWKLIEETPP
ncbi:hypothetical protein ACFPN2_21450 [Steroidobacter flavus]|uniref:Peptidase S8/S53 domain-containing protein n=1 Tax=Steroidobacter flavus TaxID=1842136 RepID=A0ABV8SVL4_9GAMM